MHVQLKEAAMELKDGSPAIYALSKTKRCELIAVLLGATVLCHMPASALPASA